MCNGPPQGMHTDDGYEFHSKERELQSKMPQLIFQTLKNNYLSQDNIIEIGITRATAYTGPNNVQNRMGGNLV